MLDSSRFVVNALSLGSFSSQQQQQQQRNYRTCHLAFVSHHGRRRRSLGDDKNSAFSSPSSSSCSIPTLLWAIVDDQNEDIGETSVMASETVATLPSSSSTFEIPHTATADKTCPILNVVPSYPLIGSFLPWLIPMPQKEFPHRFQLSMTQRFGSFYKFGIPTLGRSTTDLQPDLHVITDPQEMRKVVNSLPPPATAPTAIIVTSDDSNDKYRYPVGFVEQQWPFEEYLRKHQSSKAAGIFQRGASWQEARQTLQSLAGMSLVSPSSSALSRGAQAGSRKINPSFLTRDLNRAAFDMFERVVFGTDHPELSDVLFQATLDGMLEAQAIRRSPWQSIQRSVFGRATTPRVAEFFQILDTVVEVVRQRIQELQTQTPRELWTTAQRESLVGQALLQNKIVTNKEKDDNKDHVDVQELACFCLVLLVGAIDTTAGIMAWNVLQLACHPNEQELLYQEITSIISEIDNDDDESRSMVVRALLDPKQAPYLHGVVRETHRLTPAVTVNVIKELLDETVIHGVTLPKRAAVMLDSVTEQRSVDPDHFVPERWFAKAVEARRDDTNGEKSTILDHPYMATPFGQGPRRCPGAIVALQEVHIFLAQFVMDWKIQVDASVKWSEVPATLQTGPVPVWPQSLQITPRTD